MCLVATEALEGLSQTPMASLDVFAQLRQVPCPGCAQMHFEHVFTVEDCATVLQHACFFVRNRKVPATQLDLLRQEMQHVKVSENAAVRAGTGRTWSE